MRYGRQREAAEPAVAAATGVRNVIDDIDLGYDADPVDVTLLVQDALDRNAVVSAAWMAGSVFEVRDDLVITS